MVFPARAGVILDGVDTLVYRLRLSRTSGGDPDRMKLAAGQTASFPHERG